MSVSAATLTDEDIRKAYHRKRLSRHHANSETVVVDELGLQHGKCRVDIAVVNGHLAGHEIKSDVDSLARLRRQIEGYNEVLDRVTLVLGEKHLHRAVDLVPAWWGLVSVYRGTRGAILFRTIRRAAPNPRVDDYCVAQLLWRNETRQILAQQGIDERRLRTGRSSLYRLLVSLMSSGELRECVRRQMKLRSDWRSP